MAGVPRLRRAAASGVAAAEFFAETQLFRLWFLLG